MAATERDEEVRSAWRERLSRVDPRRLVFVDECSTKVRMVPLRARAPKGERAYGKAPKNWEKNVTLISSISLQGGTGASMSVEGSADGEAFLLYVERFLCPSLKRGQKIVVMDNNLQVHKMRRVRELIEERGCSLVFLAELLAGLRPHRAGVLEGEGVAEESQSQELRGAGGGDRESVVGGDAGGRTPAASSGTAATGRRGRFHYENRSKVLHMPEGSFSPGSRRIGFAGLAEP